jgi:hypothetical protein|tara:strand:- start:146 stop:352 length:207 start_codon:yes stop_codon:yes gene_type:complete
MNNTYKKNKVVKDYKYWQIHKEEFENHFWTLDGDIRQLIKDNPRSQEGKNFEKKLERLVSDRLKLTTI